MSKKTTMWGSPAPGAKWGSPMVKTNSSGNPPSENQSLHTPLLLGQQQDSSPSPFSSMPGNGHGSTPPIKKQFSTPPNFSPRPLYHSSPMNLPTGPRPVCHSSPLNPGRTSYQGDGGGPGGHHFNTSFSRGRGNSPRGSPHGYTPHGRHNFQQRSNFRQDSNPGGSANIDDYIHPSMFDDPWRNLPATPLRSDL